MGHSRKKKNNETSNNIGNIEGIDTREIELLQDALKSDEQGVMNAMVNHILNTFNSQGYNFKNIEEILEYMQNSYKN